ncbi:hypothetical protein RirG_015890 [Rhizophagus irregularis DAOM 197198w]|uniref:Uncharacterized protein n=1 Tax=Rhizophagus irregularis (strain DAOM 197198w) TaxID=1432141 RepID=A0A015M030_RHIIW|nr:hypothetical protein RirG_015890 [Rhizophagus irregularis DAOM 197198w]
MIPIQPTSRMFSTQQTNQMFPTQQTNQTSDDSIDGVADVPSLVEDDDSNGCLGDATFTKLEDSDITFEAGDDEFNDCVADFSFEDEDDDDFAEGDGTID